MIQLYPQPDWRSLMGEFRSVLQSWKICTRRANSWMRVSRTILLIATCGSLERSCFSISGFRGDVAQTACRRVQRRFLNQKIETQSAEDAEKKMFPLKNSAYSAASAVNFEFSRSLTTAALFRNFRVFRGDVFLGCGSPAPSHSVKNHSSTTPANERTSTPISLFWV